MQCTVIKPGFECTFANRTGCGFGSPDQTCEPVVDQCDGCDHIHEYDGRKFCTVYSMPSAKWRFGICNLASHVKIEEAKSEKKLNPLKASKRAGR